MTVILSLFGIGEAINTFYELKCCSKRSIYAAKVDRIYMLSHLVRTKLNPRAKNVTDLLAMDILQLSIFLHEHLTTLSVHIVCF